MRSTSRSALATGVVAAGLFGLGLWPGGASAAETQHRHGPPAAPLHQALAVVPVTFTRRDTIQIPSTQT